MKSLLFGRVAFVSAVAYTIATGFAQETRYWASEVLSYPSTYVSAASGDAGGDWEVTDETNATGWGGITLFGGATLTLGWGDEGFQAGPETMIYVNHMVNPWPSATGSGFTARLLLADGSYSSAVNYAEGGPADSGKIIEGEMFITRQGIDVSSLYSGPLAIRGIELSNLDGGGSTSYSLLGIYATETIPEPSMILFSLLGSTACLVGRRRPYVDA